MTTRGAQKRIYEILELSRGDAAGRAVDLFLITLIVCNVAAVTLATVHSLAVEYRTFFHVFEEISVFIFTIEYVLRMWVCVVGEAYRGPVAGRIKYFFSPFALIDLIAIAPFYLPMLIPVNLIFIRALRLLRLLRLLKLGRYSESIRTIGTVIRMKKEELLVALAFTIVLLLMASSIMYLVENGSQPDSFSSIPAAMWWAIETLTTVGYGDMYPVTPLGKVLGGIISVLGVGLFVLPAGILAAGYSEQIHRRRERVITCPKCGHEVHVPAAERRSDLPPGSAVR